MLYNLNVDDYEYDSPETVQTAKDAFHTQLGLLEFTPNISRILAINHDIEYQTAWNLTDYLLGRRSKEPTEGSTLIVTDMLKNAGFSKSITVGDCMGDPPENWYRHAGGAPRASKLVRKNLAYLNPTFRYPKAKWPFKEKCTGAFISSTSYDIVSLDSSIHVLFSSTRMM